MSTEAEVLRPGWPSRFDRWLFAEGDFERYLLIRRALAVLMALRIATWRYHDYAELPKELVHHVWYWSWLQGMPPVQVMIAIQVIGVAAAIAFLVGWRPNVTFPAAWAAFVALAGLRAGLGKVLHNDALPILAMVPFLWSAPIRSSDPSAPARSGWPLRAAQVVVATIYFATGMQKLVSSGPAWVASDNMHWIMVRAADGANFLPGVPEWIASEPVVWHVSALLLIGLELTFPLVFVNDWFRRVLVSGAIAMHLVTLVTLELDYMSWVFVDLALFINWIALRDRWRSAGGSEPVGAVESIEGGSA